MKKMRGSIRQAGKRLRRRQHQVEGFGQHTEKNLDQNFFNRLNKFGLVWRFVSAWTLLFVLLLGCLVAQNQALNKQYQTIGPVPGGLYTEGILGSFTNANPMYATGEVDVAVSRLVFSGLLKYDDNNQLAGDLAESWSVNERGNTYTFKMRPNLTWQDGKPVTADDVVFTYTTIQNPDAQSPFSSSWRNITITAIDPLTVTFTLANPLVSFPYNLTSGIVPAHILRDVPVSDLRSISFNTSRPVGAGPFKWDAVEVIGTTPQTAEVRIGLSPFQDYWQGAPKLRSFVVRAYAEESEMLDAYRNHDLSAMAGLTTVPENIAEISGTQIHSLKLNAATMVFFKSSAPALSDVKVRKALIQAIDQMAVLKQLDYATRLVKSPFLQGQVGYTASLTQSPFNVEQAKAELAAGGYVAGPAGILQKGEQKLIFDLYTDDNPEYTKVANYLSKEWRKLGIVARVNALPAEDLKNTLAGHAYDAVLHGISIGTDPDVFVYWDSSQTDIRSVNRLNFSEYKSSVADASLQAGRSTVDNALRVVKYQPFLKSWQQDAPALGLYQPRYLYVTRGEVYGLGERSINASVDRFYNVDNWMIRTGGITN